MAKFLYLKVCEVAELLYSKAITDPNAKFELRLDETPPFYALNEAAAVGMREGWLLQKYKKQLDDLTLEQLKKYPNFFGYEEIEQLPVGAKRALQYRVAMAGMRAMDMDEGNLLQDWFDPTLTALELLLMC